ncbi:MAG: hypothetical protein ISR51_00085 [Rhodospirillales bacterium]|nr:hypothetical protein [Alphaproteobacteria bacterium]MBL6947047.1 hypothetical protein [Rhodospirillales bacterium]
MLEKIHLKVSQAKKAALKSYATLFHLFYHLKYAFFRFVARYIIFIISVVLFLLIAISIYYIPALQNALEPYFATNGKIEGARSLLLTLGGALIAATTIAFSFMMFAIQINVERLRPPRHARFIGRGLPSDGILVEMRRRRSP